MAKPIKETPILKGKDAIKFLETIKENEKKKVSKEEIAKIELSFQKLKGFTKLV